MMKRGFRALLFLIFLLPVLWYTILTSPASREVAAVISRIDSLTKPSSSSGYPAIHVTLRIDRGDGIPKELTGHPANFSFQGPDKLRLTIPIEGKNHHLGRNGNTISLSVPHKNFSVIGRNDVPRFKADPESIDPITLPDCRLPVTAWQRFLLPAVIEANRKGENGIEFTFRNWAAAKIGISPSTHFSLTQDDEGWPSKIGYREGKTDVVIALDNRQILYPPFGEIPPDLAVPFSTEPEKVALSHLAKFVEVALSNMDSKIATLPPANGDKKLIAEHGNGRLEDHDGTRVLFLKGTPEEMGEQHGTLLADESRNIVDRIVYGVGVGSSLDKGRWFFGEIEAAQNRLEPFIDQRYLREMDALAKASGMHPQEARLSNFFPELFHCSGFAVHGKATMNGRIFHGRVLDYLRGLGLEQNAVVIVVDPDQGHSWVNVGYASFVGTVTAMNEKGIAIGEMGGRGEGNWDGNPMAQLMREVMEKASTLEEATSIMRDSPRTCEYYYVISDGNAKQSVGIKATPEIFETIYPGESHHQLSDPIEDTVLLSSGDRYQELVKRVRTNYGKFDADSARELMSRPVCMTSNIQSVLFAPDTLDFWVANADSANVASHTRYTQYNLKDLLQSGNSEAELTKVSVPIK